MEVFSSKRPHGVCLDRGPRRACGLLRASQRWVLPRPTHQPSSYTSQIMTYSRWKGLRDFTKSWGSQVPCTYQCHRKYWAPFKWDLSRRLSRNRRSWQQGRYRLLSSSYWVRCSHFWCLYERCSFYVWKLAHLRSNVQFLQRLVGWKAPGPFQHTWKGLIQASILTQYSNFLRPKISQPIWHNSRDLSAS